MKDFVIDLTKEERTAILSALSTMEQRASGVAWTTADTDTLKSLVTKLGRVLLDDAVLSAEDRDYNLSVDPLNQASQTNISLVSANDTYANWSNDGKNLVMTSNRESTNYEIYVMDMFGINATRITTSTENNVTPAWSPNGYKIAFARELPGGGIPYNPTLHIMNTDGTDLVNMGVAGKTPIWSPDGSMIVFERADMAGGSVLYIMYADGTDVRPLLPYFSETGFYEPTWSPDNKQVAYRGYDSFTNKYQIYKINVDGTGETKLTTSSVESSYSPNWSPNGRRIAYSTTVSGNREIYTMKTDGTDVVRLTNNLADDLSPKYSPDGTLMVISSTRDGYYQLYTMNADGVPISPEYRHEYLMSADEDYFNAWAYEFSQIYKPTVDASTRLTNSMLRGRQNYTYRERDPAIVDRSLYRHMLRSLRENEVEPLEVVGKNSPKGYLFGGGKAKRANIAGGTISSV